MYILITLKRILITLLREFKHWNEIKINFKLPKKNKILIFDRQRLFFLDKIITKKKMHVLDLRLESINISILMSSILKKGFKELAKEYIKNYILAVNPKIILTFTDYNPTFYKLKELLPECKFKTIAVQSSLRYKSTFNAFSINNEKYKCDYFFTFSEESKKLFSKYIQSKYCIIGSYQNNLIKKINFKNKKKKILLVSQFKTPLFEKSKVYFYEKKIVEFLLKYCENNSYLFKIAVRSNISLEILNPDACAKIYLKYFRNVEKTNLVGGTNQINNYSQVDNSDLIIFLSSTLGFEAIARGKKVIGFPQFSFYKGQFKEYFIEKLSGYTSFEKKLDEVNSISMQTWRKKIKKSKLKFCFDSNNSKFRNLLRRLAS